MTAAFIVCGICLLFEMFFAASEISVISCDRVGLRREAAAGGRAAKLLERLLEAKQRLLATTLTGTQLSVVVSTIVMAYALRRYHPERAELLLFLGLTPTLVVFGEIVPKTIGQQYAEWVARRIVFPLWGASVVFQPLVWPLTRFTSFIMRIFRLPESRKLVTREQLELLVHGAGDTAQIAITEGERRMISRIFEFTDKTVYDVMVPLSDTVVVAEEADLDEAAKQIEESQYTRLPVYRERTDRIVGTVHAFDVLKAGRSQLQVGAIARAPIFVPTTQPAIDLLVELQRARQGMAVVVDEYGGAVGVATVEDILEEVVGEIEDEHDTAAPAIRREAEGVWRVDARTKVTDVNRSLKVELPEGEDYESMAGLMLDQLKHIPREGESVKLAGVVLKVTRSSDRAVEEVQIRMGKRR